LAIILIFGQIKKAEIQMAPIFGIMVGVLYSYTDETEGREHWIQCCFFFLSITVIWTNPPNGLK
jgi:hypothetical protein